MCADHRLAIVEPWFGQSHKAFFSGIANHSKLNCSLFTLPARKWRWRMRTGAAYLAPKLKSLKPKPDALLVSDYVNLPLLFGLCPEVAHLPTAIYFLENQLTYPVREGSRRDFEFIAINVLSCHAATRAVFCSQDQLDAMLDALPAFLSHDPDGNPDALVCEIEKKSCVIPIGIDFERLDHARSKRPDRIGKPLRIVWPHRFEHDKNPDDFFSVLLELKDEGLPFEVAVLGLGFTDLPESMVEAKSGLKNHIVAWDFLKGRAYADELAAADVVVSTAFQETQGIAVIEAIRAGCDPLLPNRLSYPEVLGAKLAQKHLYKSKGDLRRRLRWMMRHPERVRATSNHWREMDRFGWPAVAPQFDNLVHEMTQLQNPLYN